MAFAAKWPGDCRDCDDGIQRGELVEFDDDRNLLHVLCPESLRGGKPKPVCPGCFLELPVTGRCQECFPDD
jgi:hypothetical protein